MKNKSAQGILETVATGIDKHLENGSDVNVFSMPARMPIVNNFALLFHDNFLMSIEEYNLSRNDIRVMLKIIDLMKFGNLIKLSWIDVGSSLNITSNNIVRHVKNLKKAKLIIEDTGGSLYLNPQIIAKGKFLRKDGDDTLIETLDLGANALENTPMSISIKTPSIIEKEKREHWKNQQTG